MFRRGPPGQGHDRGSNERLIFGQKIIRLLQDANAPPEVLQQAWRIFNDRLNPPLNGTRMIMLALLHSLGLTTWEPGLPPQETDIEGGG